MLPVSKDDNMAEKKEYDRLVEKYNALPQSELSTDENQKIRRDISTHFRKLARSIKKGTEKASVEAVLGTPSFELGDKSARSFGYYGDKLGFFHLAVLRNDVLSEFQFDRRFLDFEGGK